MICIYLSTVDHLVPPQPLLWEVVQDLQGTAPTQEICPVSCGLHGPHPPGNMS